VNLQLAETSAFAESLSRGCGIRTARDSAQLSKRLAGLQRLSSLIHSGPGVEELRYVVHFRHAEGPGASLALLPRTEGD